MLLAAEGVSNRQIAALVGMNQHTVSHWRRRFETERLAGSEDRPRPGRPQPYRVRGWITRPDDPGFWERAADVCGLSLMPPKRGFAHRQRDPLVIP